VPFGVTHFSKLPDYVRNIGAGDNEISFRKPLLQVASGNDFQTATELPCQVGIVVAKRVNGNSRIMARMKNRFTHGSHAKNNDRHPFAPIGTDLSFSIPSISLLLTYT
jgi:hypothetical protein